MEPRRPHHLLALIGTLPTFHGSETIIDGTVTSIPDQVGRSPLKKTALSGAAPI